MNDSPIEDILIERHPNTSKKRKNKLLVLIFILLLILAVLFGTYWYLKSNVKGTNKQIFFNAISNANLDFFTDNEVYSEIVNKFITTNSETQTDISLSTTMELPEDFKGTDISKFGLNLKTVNRNEDKKNYVELGVSYSDNKIFDIKAINTEDKFGIISDEIVNKYVGYNKENSQDVKNLLGITNSNIEDISYLSFDDIDLSKEERNQKLKEYVDSISDILTDEKFVAEDNIVLEKEGRDSKNVTAYKLELSKEEISLIYNTLFSKFQNDDEFINKIITGKKEEYTNAIEDSSQIQDNESTNQIENQTEEPIEEQVDVQEDNQLESQNENVTNDLSESSSLQPIGVGEDELREGENNVDLTSVGEENSGIETTNLNSSLKLNFEKQLTMKDIMESLVFGKKLKATSDEVKDVVSKFIKENTFSDGVTITVYVSDENTEKITFQNSDNIKLEVELNPVSASEKNVIVTYVALKDKLDFGSDDSIVYSADNTISDTTPNVTEKQKNGFKLEFTKTKNDASTNIKLTYSFIENEEINRKFSIDLNTVGTVGSKTFDNELVYVYMNNDGEFKANVENKMKFSASTEIEELTDENCLFLDTLSDEDFTATINAIKEKTEKVIESKKENLDFIDTNTQTSLIQENNTRISRDEARNLLVNTISEKMGEAANKGEQYTLNNVKDLQIEGHEISVEIENDVATIVIDTIKFTLDSNFTLNDAE